ncbi:Pol polyprotein [Plakobranchus ocellatus]|uniref:Pol polyprotein n=1 Tax=Plakobranchus ocellatus TaxID=259542 RepID=A0AAV3YY03_9GAST|nr:Pol polyprotein [Plakobranchus ocellatus]
MRKQVQKWTASECLSCQKLNVGTHVKASFAVFEIPGRSFSYINVDLIGLLQTLLIFSLSLESYSHGVPLQNTAKAGCPGSEHLSTSPSTMDLNSLHLFGWQYSFTSASAFIEDTRTIRNLMGW